ncbi:hypothetical protein AB1Y20_009193 [Prymnesium parvum]|uniref:Calmodulin-lysine N-methyltransferase n=1 Tax=Prymnesium parvum TaxID=97485 RepID=A0AB34K1E1_PRYPA
MAALPLEEEWAVETVCAGECTLRIHHIPEQQYWDLNGMGLHIWPAARLLCDYLLTHPASFSGCRSVCELGSGTGIVGLVYAKLYGTEEVTVAITDNSPRALKLMEQNVAFNQFETTVHVRYLRWGEGIDVAQLPCAKFDCVLASDCTFSVDLVPHFLATVDTLLAERSGQLVMCAVMGGVGAFEETINQAPRYGLRLVEPKQPPLDPTTTSKRSIVLRFERA